MANKTSTKTDQPGAAKGSGLADYADLARPPLADLLVEQAVIERSEAAVRAEFEAELPNVPQEMSPFVETLLRVIGRQTAAIDQLRQQIDASYRDRSEMLRIDPLPFIPEARRMTPGATPKKMELSAASLEFAGSGWFNVETNGDISWRWSDRDTGATLVLPTLGGGKLHLVAKLMMPFGNRCTNENVTVMVNDVPLALTWTEGHGMTLGTFSAEFTLPEDDGLSSFTLRIQSAMFEDPRTGANRDPRRLAVGLRSLVLDQIGG